MKREIGQCKDCIRWMKRELIVNFGDCDYRTTERGMGGIVYKNYGCWHWKSKKELKKK